jgi:hypothetical protein
MSYETRASSRSQSSKRSIIVVGLHLPQRTPQPFLSNTPSLKEFVYSHVETQTITTPIAHTVPILNAPLNTKSYFGQSIGRMTKPRPANRTIFTRPTVSTSNVIVILKDSILEAVFSQSCLRKLLIMLMMLVCLIFLVAPCCFLYRWRCLGVAIYRVKLCVYTRNDVLERHAA